LELLAELRAFADAPTHAGFRELEHPHHAVADEELLAGEDRERRRGEAEDVGRRPDRLFIHYDLLRRGVARRAHRALHEGLTEPNRPRDAEVRYLEGLVRRLAAAQDVVRLDVAVDDVDAVHRIEPRRDRLDGLRGALRVERRARLAHRPDDLRLERVAMD